MKVYINNIGNIVPQEQSSYTIELTGGYRWTVWRTVARMNDEEFMVGVGKTTKPSVIKNH